LEREGVAPDDRDYVEAKGVLVGWIPETGLSEELACHEVLFGVHFENASAQPFVVDCRSVYSLRVYLFCPFQVFEGVLVLLDGDIAVRPIDVNVENQEIIHFL